MLIFKSLNVPKSRSYIIILQSGKKQNGNAARKNANKATQKAESKKESEKKKNSKQPLK